MSFLKSLTLLPLCLGIGATAALADGHISGAIKARQSVMQLNAYYLGQLGAMAKEEAPYDAAVAASAAASLASLNALDQSMMWPEGSDTENAENTRALPAIWTDGGGIGTRIEEFSAAVEAMNAAAGTDLASLQGAIGGLGKSCGGCHEDYRQPR